MHSDILTSADPVSQASETPDHSIESNTGSTQSPTSHSLPLKFSFCIVYYSCFAIVVLGCVLPFEHTHTFLIAFLVIFGIISVILFGGSICKQIVRMLSVHSLTLQTTMKLGPRL